MHIGNKTAVVIGATGLVGTSLVKRLCEDVYFQKVVIFHRKVTGVSNAKIEEHIIDFDSIDEWRHLIKGDVLFSALGTTINNAGSKEAQYLVDHTYQFRFAKIASENGIKTYVLVSSAGANQKSSLFYLRMKGELEKDVAKLNFESTYFIRPNLLMGQRKKVRLGEFFSEKILLFLNALGILSSQKPIYANDVAETMILASKENSNGTTILEGENLSRKKRL
jgi:uncharacterized protein YbjT (DUF2867 family)